MRRSTRGALLVALMSFSSCLSPGCAAITEAPRLFGGTRALIERPIPITEAEVRLGPERAIEPGPAGLVLLNLAWIVDLPLSFVLDMLLSPLAVFVFDEGPSSSAGGDRAPRRFQPPIDSDVPPPLDDYEGGGGGGGGGGDGGDPLAPS